MFDTPDLRPLCIAPFIAIVVGVFVYVVGSIISVIVDKASGKKQAWLRKAILIVAISLVPIACIASVTLEIGVREPAPWFKPSDQSVVGTYQLNPDDYYSIALPTHELAFNDDGSFYMRNVPALWKLTGEWNINQVEYIDGSGVWHIDMDYSLQPPEWAIIAQFSKINGEVDNQVMHFYFEGHIPPYMLVYLDDGMFRFMKK